MGIILNDIVWWKISLESIVNAWVPGVFTFLLGLWLGRIDDQRKLRQKLKNDILEIFIPVFNSGQTITAVEVENAIKRMRYTLNAYRRIYPDVFSKDAEEKLNAILAEGFFTKNGVNSQFMEPDGIQNIIKML